MKEAAGKTCTVADCNRSDYYAKGLCRTHYSLNLRNGYPGYVVREQKFCECGKPVKAKGMCKAHYQSWFYYNQEVKPVDLNHWATKETPSYTAAHARIRRERGRAQHHICVVCGDQANNWALKADATDLLTEPEGRYKGTKYSVDPFAYQPMCQACHKAFDATEGHRKGVGGRKKKVAA